MRTCGAQTPATMPGLTNASPAKTAETVENKQGEYANKRCWESEEKYRQIGHRVSWTVRGSVGKDGAGSR